MLSQSRRFALRGFFSIMAAGLLALSLGCESSDGGGGSDVEGVWALYSGSSISGSPYWYIHFNADGSYFISNNADGTGVRVTGDYEQSGNEVKGPFTNPGVGEGRIEATIDDGVMSLDFIEYWHTPNKVVPYTGEKI